VLGFITLVLVLLAVKSDQRVTLAAGAVWAVVLGLGWYKTQRNPTVSDALDGPAGATVD
jgi:L-asparagine transporter-like permease